MNPDPRLTIECIFLVVLVASSAFFSSAETAFMTVNTLKLRGLSEEGNKRAKLSLSLLDDQPRLLSTILVGNNIVNLSASSLATMIAVNLLGSYGAGVSTFVLTLLILILGEVSPKTLATVHSLPICLAFCRVIRALEVIFTPFVFIVNLLSRGILRLFGTDPSDKDDTVTEGELRTMVDVSHEDGVIEEEERDMIYNLFHFNDSLAREIMIPRIDMVMIEAGCSYEGLLELYRKNMLTRFPVYENDNDNVIGFVNMKDVILIEPSDDFSIKSLMRRPYYTHERKNTAELLLEMRDHQINIAIVLDDYGLTAGMITMEDLLEEIVGEIRDEYDDDEVDIIRAVSDTEYEIDAKANIDDINDALGLSLEDEDYDTIGGFVIGLSDEFPEKGESFSLPDGTLMRVDEIENNRIDKIYLRLPEKDG